MLNKSAKWIYLKDCGEGNRYVKFRKEFNYNSGAAKLSVSADSRYALYINGEFAGAGPVRAYPDYYKYDEYDITGYLVKGKNVIAVLVNSFGASTFQYLQRPGGLIASIDFSDKTIVTNTSWFCGIAEEYVSFTPRISCQQHFEEQVDMTLYDGWKEINYRGGKMEKAVTASACAKTHKNLAPSGIPLLTRDMKYCRRVVEVCALEEKKPFVVSVNFEKYMPEFEFNSTPLALKVCFAVEFESGKEDKAEIAYANYGMTVNGKTAENNCFELKKTNYAVLKFEGIYHVWEFTFALKTKSELKLKNVYMIGPFAKTENSPWSGFSNAVEGKPLSVKDWTELEAKLANGVKDIDKAYVKNINEAVLKNNIFALNYGETAQALPLSGSPPLRGFPSIENLVSCGDYAEIKTDGRDIRILLDFGTECVSRHVIECIAEKGTIIDFHNFEFIQPDGRRNYAEGMNNTMRYVCAEGYQKYISITRRGFRYSYVTIRNCSEIKLKIGAENAVYPQTSRGSFECDNYLLNRIVEIGKNTLKCCSEDTYTDCPTYEQTLWVGDARNEALCDIVANGDSRLWYRCLELTGQSLDYAPLTMSQVPSGWWNILPAWTFLWMRSVCEYSYYTNDKAGVNKLAVFLEKNINGLIGFINKDNLFEINAWNMFDWADMDCPADGVITHLNCFAVQALSESAELFKYLNKTAFAEKCLKTARKISEAVNKYMWNEEKRAYTDCIRYVNGAREQSKVFSQQTHTVAFTSGAASGERKARCKEIVLNPPEGFVTSGSPFFEFFMLEILMKENNENDFINRIGKSWGFMADTGCDTFWEMWSWVQPGGRLTRSHCHGWSAAPVYYLTEYVLGVKPVERGYKKVQIKPHACGLNWCRGVVPTPYGDIRVSWKKTDDGLKIDYDAPEEVEVTL